jgi:hypothetical protein
MKKRPPLSVASLVPATSRLAAVLLTAALAAPAGADPLHQQSFVLQPGWNAIYLEVRPVVNDAALVFQGLPIESVWAWSPSRSPVEFIADPSEPELRRRGWLGYFPPSRPESFLTDLHRVHANRAYLVKLGGDQPVTWTVTGRPALRRVRWVPDSFNLVGAAVDETQPPTFGDFFAPSPAHAGQAVWRLEPDGQWRQVTSPFATPMTSGEAFWIYTAGASGYAGPMGVEVPQGDGLDFGQSLDELELVLTNLSAQPRTFTVSLPAGGAGVVAYRRFDAASARFDWPDLPASLSLDAGPGAEVVLRLGVRRSALSQERLEALLQVSDGAGFRKLLPFAAAQAGAPAPGARSASKSHGGPFAGLWVGTVSVDRVAEVHGDAPTEPTATASTFDFRILIHLAGDGQARLLKEVIQMWKDGDGENPGHYVLVTRDDRIPDFQGAALRDGEPVGRRMSTAVLDFDERSGGDWDLDTRTLTMDGTFGDTLDVTFELAADHPTNPYYHRYHDEHDGVCEGSCAELYKLTRTLTLTFGSADPQAAGGKPRPDWGTRRLAGAYEESLSGLHRSTLHVSGTFSLQRVSDQEELNQ